MDRPPRKLFERRELLLLTARDHRTLAVYRVVGGLRNPPSDAVPFDQRAHLQLRNFMPQIVQRSEENELFVTHCGKFLEHLLRCHQITRDLINRRGFFAGEYSRWVGFTSR